MEKEPTKTGLQKTLDEMKRKLQEEREAAEPRTLHMRDQRNQRLFTGESHASKLEVELAEARKLLTEQKETTEKWIQQVGAERDAGRARLRETESRTRKLEQELAAATDQLREQRDAAERLIRQLTAEQNESRTQLREVESRTRTLE